MTWPNLFCLNCIYFYQDAGEGIDTDEGVAVVGGMVVGTFEEDRIAKTIAHPEVNAYRRKYISQQLFTIGSNIYLFHWA